MSRHFIIDGYNLIRSQDWLDAGSQPEKQQRLLSLLSQPHATGSPRNRVTVVFDGHARATAASLKPGPTRVLFSNDNDADTVIKRLVDDMTQPKDAVVVTNDRALGRWVEGAHATVLSCETFLSNARPAPARSEDVDKPDGEKARLITEHLKRLWKM